MNNNELRDKLLELEIYPDELKRSIQEMIDHTKERPLKSWERLLTALGCAVLALMLVGLLSLFINEAERIATKPMYIIMSLPIVPLILCWLFAVLLKNSIKGTERPRNIATIVYAVFGFLVYMVVGEMILGGGVSNDSMAAATITGVCVICIYVHTIELRQREHVLRSELAIEKLAESIHSQDVQHSPHE